MKYDLTKFEENLQLINDLISNLTNRSNNLTYLNLLGEYYKTINNYKISDDYEIIVDITRKFVIEIDYLMKKIIVVGLLGNNDDKFVFCIKIIYIIQITIQTINLFLAIIWMRMIGF